MANNSPRSRDELKDPSFILRNVPSVVQPSKQAAQLYYKSKLVDQAVAAQAVFMVFCALRSQKLPPLPKPWIMVVGCGHIGRLIIDSLRRLGLGSYLVVVGREAHKAGPFTRYGLRYTTNPSSYVARAKVLVLAVRSSQFRLLVSQLRGHVPKRCLIVSTAMGVTREKILQLFIVRYVVRTFVDIQVLDRFVAVDKHGEFVEEEEKERAEVEEKSLFEVLHEQQERRGRLVAEGDSGGGGSGGGGGVLAAQHKSIAGSIDEANSLRISPRGLELAVLSFADHASAVQEVFDTVERMYIRRGLSPEDARHLSLEAVFGMETQQQEIDAHYISASPQSPPGGRGNGPFQRPKLMSSSSGLRRRSVPFALAPDSPATDYPTPGARGSAQPGLAPVSPLTPVHSFSEDARTPDTVMEGDINIRDSEMSLARLSLEMQGSPQSVSDNAIAAAVRVAAAHHAAAGGAGVAQHQQPQPQRPRKEMFAFESREILSGGGGGDGVAAAVADQDSATDDSVEDKEEDAETETDTETDDDEEEEEEEETETESEGGQDEASDDRSELDGINGVGGEGATNDDDGEARPRRPGTPRFRPGTDDAGSDGKAVTPPILNTRKDSAVASLDVLSTQEHTVLAEGHLKSTHALVQAFHRRFATLVRAMDLPSIPTPHRRIRNRSQKAVRKEEPVLLTIPQGAAANRRPSFRR